MGRVHLGQGAPHFRSPWGSFRNRGVRRIDMLVVQALACVAPCGLQPVPPSPFPTISNLQFPIYNFQFTIYNLQFTISNFQFTIYNLQYSPHPALPRPRSLDSFHFSFESIFFTCENAVWHYTKKMYELTQCFWVYKRFSWGAH